MIQRIGGSLDDSQGDLRAHIGAARPSVEATLVGMPRGVDVTCRVVEHIRIPVERLGIARLRHQRVRADKPPQHRVVVAGPVVVEGQARILPLAGELAVGGGGAVAR